MLDARTRMKPVLWLVMLTAVFGQLVYPIYYGSMIDGTWQGVLFQITRIVLLVTATVWATVSVLRPNLYPEPSDELDVRDEHSEVGVNPSRSLVRRAAISGQLHVDSTHWRPALPIF